MELYSAFKAAVFFGLVAGLAACSSGSDSNNGSTGGNQLPVVDAGNPQTVDEFDNVALLGTASDGDGDSLTYLWEQASGAAVTINNAASLSADFDAPDVLATDTPVVLGFRLTVDDGTGSRSDTVNITVNDAGLGQNSVPIADAGSDSSVLEFVDVDLDGTGSSDPDGTALSFSWAQTAGPSVSITNGNSALASFTSPDVAPGITEQLTFALTVDDGTDTATDEVTVSVSEAMSLVTVAGRLTYERPATRTFCRGFDFNNVALNPVRLATVFLLDGANNVLGTSQTDVNGNYSFTDVPANTDVRVRVRAELLQTSGLQRWQVYVRDNTSSTTLPLNSRPIYEVQWALFNSGSTTINNADFTAGTGWIGGGYDDQQRLAAPLAILDSILNGVLLVTSVDDVVDLGRIDAFWSVNNTYSRTERWDDEDNGQLVTAFYTGNNGNPSLFLRGDAVGRFPESSINTDEFDAYVILHEWGHFFEDQLSRSDSRGGFHSIPGTVDALVAFGEGWGNAIGAIAQNDPIGCDTTEPSSAGSDLDMETFNLYTDEQGFFNEMSVATFIYDLWDTNTDPGDPGSVGFGPIYETMTNFQRDTFSFTTLFSFGTGILQNVDPVDIAFVEQQLTRENIDTAGLDIWGSQQVTAPSFWHDNMPVRDLMPLYTELTPGGPTQNLCVNVDQRDRDSENNPGLWRYLYFTIDSPQSLTLTIQANPVPPPTNDPPPGPGDPEIRDRADPDAWLWRNGRGYDFTNGRSGDDDQEILNMSNLSAATYTIQFHDWRYIDEERSSDYPDRVCFDFTLN